MKKMNDEMLFQGEKEERYRGRKATLDKPEGDKDWHVQVLIMRRNIARGTTDPEIESVHLSNLLNDKQVNQIFDSVNQVISMTR